MEAGASFLAGVVPSLRAMDSHDSFDGVHPMNSQHDEREAFEAWARACGYQRDELDRCRIGIVGPEYYNINTEMTWRAWQARAALAAQRARDVQQEK
jgi:hypothetical protein